MKNNLSNTTSGQIAKMAAPIFALFLSLTASAFPQTSGLNAIPAVAVSPSGMPTPQGVKVLAQVPLGGQPVTRMYTQWESGHTYLYIEHGRQQLTAVDVTRKRNPQVVTHAPAKAEAARYEELAEGGTIEVSSPSQVNAGFDSVGGRGTFSVLQNDSSEDVSLLQAFGRDSSNLADRDRNLIFFASPTQLTDR